MLGLPSQAQSPWQRTLLSVRVTHVMTCKTHQLFPFDDCWLSSFCWPSPFPGLINVRRLWAPCTRRISFRVSDKYLKFLKCSKWQLSGGNVMALTTIAGWSNLHAMPRPCKAVSCGRMTLMHLVSGMMDSSERPQNNWKGLDLSGILDDSHKYEKYDPAGQYWVSIWGSFSYRHLLWFPEAILHVFSLDMPPCGTTACWTASETQVFSVICVTTIIIVLILLPVGLVRIESSQ